jgi:hypothetical protein
MNVVMIQFLAGIYLGIGLGTASFSMAEVEDWRSWKLAWRVPALVLAWPVVFLVATWIARAAAPLCRNCKDPIDDGHSTLCGMCREMSCRT